MRLTWPTGLALLALLSAPPALAREQIQIAGSSTVLPYATIVAEAFGENAGFPTPVVEGGGSGAGRKKLCEGVGETTIDIANSSSPIKDSDLTLCAENGVTPPLEIRIGYDGIVFVSDLAGPDFALGVQDLWRAVAAEVPQGEALVANTAATWAAVAPALPDQVLQLFIPGTKHGSREVFDQEVLMAGCKAAGAHALYAARAGGGEDSAKAADEACLVLRKDGAVVDIDGDYSETLARIDANKLAIGVVGLSFYENNTDRLKVATIDGVAPSVATISAGQYPVSRPLFFYLKTEHLATVPGLAEYAAFFLSDGMAGPEGTLVRYGLVPDPDRATVQATLAAAVATALPEQTENPVADLLPQPSLGLLALVLAVLAVLGHVLGRKRALATSGGDIRKLHSLPVFYGRFTSLLTIVPAAVAALVLAATGYGAAVVWGAALALAGLGLVLGLMRVAPAFRARNAVEAFVMVLLIGASLIAVLTTLGIVGSLVLESWEFFKLYPVQDFLFSTVWDPQFRGGSDLGIWPLIWGTLYVSAIALIVAVPIGLMSAIYLAEYASPAVRGWAKPAIELLAGIPTIVYGLFALVTVGPLLRDWFAQPMGLGDSSSSVMTAGLVMGIMVIPFVSSLSDDIINAVPQSLRDGSLGLGATPSETTRQVVLPAALPGVVGAVLLAASRAIGETMIVVMGAGAAAKLSLNPFEAMTTVTVKIVSQLTGDTEFASPETLVAFALGLALFLFTLALNVIALVIVRKYREQYE